MSCVNMSNVRYANCAIWQMCDMTNVRYGAILLQYQLSYSISVYGRRTGDKQTSGTCTGTTVTTKNRVISHIGQEMNRYDSTGLIFLYVLYCTSHVNAAWAKLYNWVCDTHYRRWLLSIFGVASVERESGCLCILVSIRSGWTLHYLAVVYTFCSFAIRLVFPSFGASMLLNYTQYLQIEHLTLIHLT